VTDKESLILSLGNASPRLSAQSDMILICIQTLGIPYKFVTRSSRLNPFRNLKNKTHLLNHLIWRVGFVFTKQVMITYGGNS